MAEDTPPPKFEAALTELEAILHDLEEGQIGLEGSLGRYEQGVRLLKYCYGLLERAERRIELCTGVDAAGNPIVQPFDEQAQTLEEKGAARSRRRSSPAAEKGARPAPDDGGPAGLF
ncbi:MAG TPA: exodeoxyribonuclease VII small subunit [Pirellulales bacterium]|nr:exodeoxyribonuclease VII small subunit [Pirellulales bacterium]